MHGIEGFKAPEPQILELLQEALQGIIIKAGLYGMSKHRHSSGRTNQPKALSGREAIPIRIARLSSFEIRAESLFGALHISPAYHGFGKMRTPQHLFSRLPKHLFHGKRHTELFKVFQDPEIPFPPTLSNLLESTPQLLRGGVKGISQNMHGVGSFRRKLHPWKPPKAMSPASPKKARNSRN
jgi:hypothetical protein